MDVSCRDEDYSVCMVCQRIVIPEMSVALADIRSICFSFVSLLGNAQFSGCYSYVVHNIGKVNIKFTFAPIIGFSLLPITQNV